MNIRKWILLFLTVALAGFLRFYDLDELPTGLNIDESSMGYNAYSILQTGKDRYGQPFPILFRSFGSFQAPIYTYLTIGPIWLFDSSAFAVRFVSAASGLIVVAATFFALYFGLRKNFTLALLASFLVGIAPWAILFNRVGTEASPGLALYSLGILFAVLSLNNLKLFPISTLSLGLATHAYYSERLVSILFIAGFILLFRKTLINKKRILIIGLALFVFTQIPHLIIAQTGAFTRRLEQVNYWNDDSFQNHAPQLINIPFGKSLYITNKFASQYTAYFSPKNLFFDPDPQNERSISNLSGFYNWMLIPFLFGVFFILKNRSNNTLKILILSMLISPIPAALTGDPFYTLRALDLFWVLTIIIALGFYCILNSLHKRYSKILLFSGLAAYSFILLYLSYFVLLKYEKNVFDYSYTKVLEISKQYDKKFVVDTSRQLGAGIRYAYLKKYDPHRLQQNLRAKIGNNYYSSFEIDESYDLGNIEAKPIEWKNDIYQDQILVGDDLAISEGQIKEHKLSEAFEVTDRSGKVVLWGYSTNPTQKCLSEAQGGRLNKNCDKWL